MLKEFFHPCFIVSRRRPDFNYLSPAVCLFQNLLPYFLFPKLLFGGLTQRTPTPEGCADCQWLYGLFFTLVKHAKLQCPKQQMLLFPNTVCDSVSQSFPQQEMSKEKGYYKNQLFMLSSSTYINFSGPQDPLNTTIVNNNSFQCMRLCIVLDKSPEATMLTPRGIQPTTLGNCGM